MPASSAAAAFPGGTSVTDLEVYGDAAPDGLAGGAPHMHLVSTEAYLVTAGAGTLQTLDATGFHETPLVPGSVVWFSPGVIHRAVNNGGLRAKVIMQNAGLPELGDAIMTFPDDVLADAERYRASAALPPADRAPEERRAAASARRDLAVDGFTRLREAIESGDTAALDRFYARAAALVRPRVEDWRQLWTATLEPVTRATAGQLAALAAGAVPHLAEGRVWTAAVTPALGMCGILQRAETTHHFAPHDSRGKAPHD